MILLLLLLVGCDEPPPPPPPRPEPATQVSGAPMQPVGPEPPPEADPEEPRPVFRIEPAEVGRQRWLDNPFRCRAISTTRYRRCRLEVREDGRVRLRFPLNSVTCDDVIFDAEGDPSALHDCHSSWLSVPADNELIPVPGPDEAWSAGTRGWRWRSDGEIYCCPGMWIMAPREARPP